MQQTPLETSESILYSLRSLYHRYGYTHYKMNKFEEYDLYVQNKDFLISDSVITFTDTSGKLLALKPDVTLSIVKNSKDTPDTLQKLYYSENVYRVTKGSRSYKEIMQVGLECIGRVDDYCIYEVLKLALESLQTISEAHVLSVSHLGLLSEVMDFIGIPSEKKSTVLHFIGEKNLHELTREMNALQIPEEKADILRTLVRMRGDTDTLLPQLQALLRDAVSEATMAQFIHILGALRDEKKLWIDFSVAGDINYYNGFLFKGFIEGIPNSVLSGGQYDMLMRRMKRLSGGIGFVVYMDAVEQLNRSTKEYDVDVFLQYDADCDLSEIGTQVRKLTEAGASVLAGTQPPADIRCRIEMKMRSGEVNSRG